VGHEFERLPRSPAADDEQPAAGGAELKRLVERGHANAELIDGRGRQRTRYTITLLGRAALEDWFATEPAPPMVEIEGVLRLLLGDQTTADDLRAALKATARQAREQMAEGKLLVQEQVTSGGPLPKRLHLAEPVAAFYGGFLRLLIAWCDETVAEIETWPDTKDVGLAPTARERYQRLLDLPDP
jgi:PadR family transcriptional regulator, regulatory protein AphA